MDALRKYNLLDRNCLQDEALRTYSDLNLTEMLSYFLENYQSSKIGKFYGLDKKKLEFDKNNINIIQPKESITTISIRWSGKGAFDFENSMSCLWIGFREDILQEDKFAKVKVELLNKMKENIGIGNKVRWHYFSFSSLDEIKKFLGC